MPDFRFETERLILRDWGDEDWGEFWRTTNTPAVMRWLGGVCDEEERISGQERIQSYRRDHGHTFWVLERKGDGAILGFCGLKRSNEEGGPIGMMEIGWRLREDAWGKGYAKEAALASLGLAFRKFAVDEVIALTVQGNEGSWGLMKRLGMRHRKDLDFESAIFDASNPLIVVYSIDHATWEELHG